MVLVGSGLARTRTTHILPSDTTLTNAYLCEPLRSITSKHIYAYLLYITHGTYGIFCAYLRNHAYAELALMKTPKEGLTGAGRVAFLARLDEFRHLIQAGWPVTVVYENHGGDNTGLSYSQFTRYVGKYIRKPTKRGAEQPTIPDEIRLPVTPQPEQMQSSASTVPATTSKRRPGFWHDPNSGNNRDDLI